MVQCHLSHRVVHAKGARSSPIHSGSDDWSSGDRSSPAHRPRLLDWIRRLELSLFQCHRIDSGRLSAARGWIAYLTTDDDEPGETDMRGRVRLLCALLLLLCVATHFQGAWCRGGRGGGGGGGRGGGSSGKRGSEGKGGCSRPVAGAAAAGAIGSRHAAGSHKHNAAGDPRGRGAWRVFGGAATLAAATLVWWRSLPLMSGAQ